jgi:hypothetical protein
MWNFVLRVKLSYISPPQQSCTYKSAIRTDIENISHRISCFTMVLEYCTVIDLDFSASFNNFNRVFTVPMGTQV